MKISFSPPGDAAISFVPPSAPSFSDTSGGLDLNTVPRPSLTQKAKVLYDYDAADKNELSLLADEVSDMALALHFHSQFLNDHLLQSYTCLFHNFFSETVWNTAKRFLLDIPGCKRINTTDAIVLVPKTLGGADLLLLLIFLFRICHSFFLISTSVLAIRFSQLLDLKKE